MGGEGGIEKNYLWQVQRGGKLWRQKPWDQQLRYGNNLKTPTCCRATFTHITTVGSTRLEFTFRGQIVHYTIPQLPLKCETAFMKTK